MEVLQIMDLVWLFLLGFLVMFRRGQDMQLIIKSGHYEGMGSAFGVVGGLLVSHGVFLIVAYLLIGFIYNTPLLKAVVALIAGSYVLGVGIGHMAGRHSPFLFQKEEGFEGGFLKGLMTGFQIPQILFLQMGFILMFLYRKAILPFQFLALEIGMILGMLVIATIPAKEGRILPEQHDAIGKKVLGGIILFLGFLLLYEFASIMYHEVYMAHIRSMKRGLDI